jgi:hypothetical protein
MSIQLRYPVGHLTDPRRFRLEHLGYLRPSEIVRLTGLSRQRVYELTHRRSSSSR